MKSRKSNNSAKRDATRPAGPTRRPGRARKSNNSAKRDATARELEIEQLKLAIKKTVKNISACYSNMWKMHDTWACQTAELRFQKLLLHREQQKTADEISAESTAP